MSEGKMYITDKEIKCYCGNDGDLLGYKKKYYAFFPRFKLTALRGGFTEIECLNCHEKEVVLTERLTKGNSE